MFRKFCHQSSTSDVDKPSSASIEIYEKIDFLKQQPTPDAELEPTNSVSRSLFDAKFIHEQMAVQALIRCYQVCIIIILIHLESSRLQLILKDQIIYIS